LDKIKEGVEWEWAKHQSFDVDPYPGLPCPRLQMKFKPVNGSWYNRFWEYGIVYPAFWGKTVFMPIGGTKQGGGGGDAPIRFGEPDMPFRDGVHIYADMATFGLPAYVIVEGSIWELQIEDEGASGRAEHTKRQIQ
jgi:hypothetical protein